MPSVAGLRHLVGNGVVGGGRVDNFRGWVSDDACLCRRVRRESLGGMGLSTLTDEEKDNIATEQLARLIFAEMKQKAGPPKFDVSNDLVVLFTGHPGPYAPNPPKQSRRFERYNEAQEILLDRGFIRWIGGALWDFSNVQFQITTRGRHCDFDKGWVAPAEPAIARLKSGLMASATLDNILEAYLSEAVGALYADRPLSVELNAGIVAERVARILWEQWLSHRVSHTKPGQNAYDLIQACRKGLAEIQGEFTGAELDSIRDMASAVDELGHIFRRTRNNAAHPDQPRVPDETTIALQVATLLQTYVPMLYRVLAIL